jgi:cell division protease FtsH
MRGAGYGGGHDEREQTLNQLLVEMDGFEGKEGVIVLAATNRPDVLDAALLRPGRFDRQVTIAMPDKNERAEIFALHFANVKKAADIDFDKLARSTPMMSGADIANMVNEAALLAARAGLELVSMKECEAAHDKIIMGTARQNLGITEKERAMTAVHESGHALLHFFLENADPLHKVTIVPHGRALGMAVSLPEQDSYSHTRGWIVDRIAICYGGYVAENLIYGETTTGTKQDLDTATDMARKMVCEWGMGGATGPINYGKEDEPIFLGREIAQHKDYSEATAALIDTEIQAILRGSLDRVEKILTENKDALQKISAALLEKETLSMEEVRALAGI